MEHTYTLSAVEVKAAVEAYVRRLAPQATKNKILTVDRSTDHGAVVKSSEPAATASQWDR